MSQSLIMIGASHATACRLTRRPLGSVRPEPQRRDPRREERRCRGDDVEHDGTATQAYKPESIRWSPDGTKLTVYRVSEEVWQSDSVAGTVKSLIAKGEWTVK